MKLVKVYAVLVQQNGHLTTPRDSWGNSILESETFETEEAAVAAIMEAQQWDDYYILPRWDSVLDWSE